jgi:hypothetical protein
MDFIFFFNFYFYLTMLIVRDIFVLIIIFTFIDIYHFSHDCFNHVLNDDMECCSSIFHLLIINLIGFMMILIVFIGYLGYS